MKCDNPNLVLVKINAYTKFGEILSKFLKILSENEILALINGHNSDINVPKMTGNNLNIDLVNINDIQNLVKFYHFVLKILSPNEIERNSDINQGP